MQLGIGMVHQHFSLIPTLTVVQNICIGLRSAGFPFLNLRRVAAEVRDLANQYQLQVDPAARVDQLSVGAQQRVEIVKALYRGAELLILDEPTAVLTPQETEGLFVVIRCLAAQGKVIINGKDLTHAYPGECIAAGVAHVPADRHHVGLALDMSIADNMVLATYDRLLQIHI